MTNKTKCAECGAMFYPNTRNAKYCSDPCRKIAKARQRGRPYVTRKSYEGFESYQKGKENACAPCIYSIMLGRFYVCDYLEKVGRPRPCKSMYHAGECACFTRKKPGRVEKIKRT